MPPLRLSTSRGRGRRSNCSASQHRHHSKVFLAPPWPEIYVTDAERRHSFEAGLAEYERLEQVYPALGYEVIRLPKTTITERADFVLAALSDSGIHERIL